MVINFLGVQVTVPEIMIDKYAKETECMLELQNRPSLNRLRDATIDILFTIAENRQALASADNYGNFVKALAIRVALSKHRILYDD